MMLELLKEVKGFNGSASVYKVSRPIKYVEDYRKADPSYAFTEYVVVSCIDLRPMQKAVAEMAEKHHVCLPPLYKDDFCETGIFPSDSEGNILSWVELYLVKNKSKDDVVDAINASQLALESFHPAIEP